jgi:hypothetical protein
MADLRTPWRVAGFGTTIADRSGLILFRVDGHCSSDDDREIAAEIVRLVNAEAERSKARAFLGGPMDCVSLGEPMKLPTASQLREAIAQGDIDRRKVMGVPMKMEIAAGHTVVTIDDPLAELTRRAQVPTSTDYRERFGVQDIATGRTCWYAMIDDAWFAMGNGSRVVTR